MSSNLDQGMVMLDLDYDNKDFISHYRYDATSQKSTAIVGVKQRYQNT